MRIDSVTPRNELLLKAIQNVEDIVFTAIDHDAEHKALVVYDTENELTKILTEAYREVISEAEFIDFNTKSKEEIIDAFNALSPRDLVVLIQSSDFRLNEFRIRIQLFQRKLKVIDHQHLFRNTRDSWETYIDALAYDTDWYRGVGWRLKKRIEETNILRILSPHSELLVTGGLEIPKPNLGDYTDMENIGGTFPIGEVFTEARDLTKMNGSLVISSYANSEFNVEMHEPFRIDIKDGVVVGWSENVPDSFPEIIVQIQTNERPLIREIGFGLNRAMTNERYLLDITAYERRLGLHFSLGEKHTVYKKQGISADKTRYHVDLFPVVSHVYADGELIFENGDYLV